MVNFDTLKILECQLGIDFEHDTFPVVLEKLAASGMTAFRLNWTPDIALCMVFDASGSKALNDALDVYLNDLERSV